MMLLQIPKKAEKFQKNESLFLRKLTSVNNIVILSPHLDDAILSMGSLLIYLNSVGKNIQIINFFTRGSKIKTAFTGRLLERAGVKDSKEYFLLREKEDEIIFKKLGNIYVKNLGFIDAAWRMKSNEQPIYPQKATLSIDKNDDTLTVKIEATLKKIIDPSGTLVFAPLARGNHVDHQLVRNIAMKNFKNVIFYTDFPYSKHFEEDKEFIQNNHLSIFDWYGDYRKKIELIMFYKTQQTTTLTPENLQLPYEAFYF